MPIGQPVPVLAQTGPAMLLVVLTMAIQDSQTVVRLAKAETVVPLMLYSALSNKARAIANNDSASREAPPTKAPFT